MEYEIVNLKEKTIIGLSARTNNSAPDMGAVIGGLWTRFYTDGIYASIPEKVNGKALGVYTDYSDDEKGDYTILTACETSLGAKAPEGTVIRTIPAGKYARFVVKGDMHKAVADFWVKLWSMDLDRAFICDYEEYQNSDMENAEIHMYIGLKG